jgi:DNA uptake protein ComE-like DNA-binding protein
MLLFATKVINLLLFMFDFNKRDRTGIITLVILLLLLFAANFAMPLLITPQAYDYSKYEGLVTKKEGAAFADTLYTKPTPIKADTFIPQSGIYVKPVVVVDINKADSLTLLDVNGIGPTFAGRIVKYRNLLGGFIKKEQLAEVYGFKDKYDGMKSQVRVSPGHKTINLNMATFKELNKHPYVDYNLTKAIFALKKKLGTFKSVDDIKQIDLVTDELYNKLAPYLTVE